MYYGRVDQINIDQFRLNYPTNCQQLDFYSECVLVLVTAIKSKLICHVVVMLFY